MSQLHRYEGREGAVTFDLKRCIHAAECVRGLPAVFDSKARPWVRPDAAGAEEIAAVVARCPTGALHFEPAQRAAAEPVPAENQVTLVPHGPLYARGRIEIAAADGTVVATDTRVALCRCGASKNKPYCDNSHGGAGFQDLGSWAKLPAQPGEPAEGAPLRVVCLPDGPLLLQGAFTLRAAEGTEAPCTRAAACRCGASGDKPFCDGSHKRIGFTS
ncbi:MAG TPA: hypothetical protein DD490_15075 [Acidobacteria bacterium]|nr:hypothetical protein [Acidobacteriota bacterium]